MFGEFATDLTVIVLDEIAASWQTVSLILLGACVLFGLEWAGSRTEGERSLWVPRWLRFGLLALVVVGGLYHAWQYAWLGDDAFISFRYSQNFAQGYGLVFNHGEWVEGFTNFLWTFILGLLHIAGASIPHTALILDLLAFVGVLLTVHSIIRKYSVFQAGLPAWTSIALACCAPFAIYATSGLETMPGVLCVVLGIRAALSGHYVWSGLFFVFGGMMRPDHILFWGTMGLALATEDLWSKTGNVFRRLDWGRYARFTLPLLCVFVPYFVFRAWLYGDIFPNTYYAKSGGLTYFSQGVKYVGVFLAGSGGFLWAPIWLLGVFRGGDDRSLRTFRVFSFLSVLIFGTYVSKVGGDFMENRFLLVLLPIVLMTIELSLRSSTWTGWSRRLVWGIGVITFGLVCTRVEVIKPFQKKWHIAAEHTWYQVTNLDPLKIRSRYFGIGKRLGKMFAKSEYKPRIAYPCVGMVGYFSNLPLVDTYGLVNRRIARKELKKRGRPGHEKRASLEEVLAEGAVLSHDIYASKSSKPLLAVKMAGTTLYLLQDVESLKSKMKKVKGIRWPKKASRVFKEAMSRKDRTALINLEKIGERALSPSLAAQLAESLGSIEEFEEGIQNWTISGEKPTLHRTYRTGMSGRTSLKLDGKGKRELMRTVTLKDGEGIGGVMAGGGDLTQGIGLYLDDKPVSTATSTGMPYFEPFRLMAPKAGLYELRIFDGDSKRDMWVDGINKFAQPLALSRMPKDIKATNLYDRWLSDRVRARTSAVDMLANQTLYFGQRWGFDEAKLSPSFKKTGLAFGSGPVFRRLPKQQPISGAVMGRFLNSFHGGDKALGQIELPRFTIEGGALHVLVAGGKRCKEVYVGLKVDGVIRRRICGRNDEVFRPHTISLEPWLGKTGQVVIVDGSKKSWGHIMVDEMMISLPLRKSLQDN